MYAHKVRRQFYMPEELAQRLDTLAAKPGSSLTAIMTDAATAWLDREGGNQLDERFGPRLDRQDRSAARRERKLDALIELLGVFVQHHLMLNAKAPPIDDAGSAIGRERYQLFLGHVERALAKGKTVSRFANVLTQTGEQA